MSGLQYVLVDVFSAAPYSGNSVPVFHDTGDLTGEQMQRITQELRHFEAVFLQRTGTPDTVRARVFDLFEELPFAGHPLIGAAAVWHASQPYAETRPWHIQLADRTVQVTITPTDGGHFGLMDQGRPTFHGRATDPGRFAAAFSLTERDLSPDLPLEVVSTGLRYLIVPVRPGALERARVHRDITSSLHDVNAQFAVLFDEDASEIRHWNNDGVLEDVATGSAAGTVGAYRLRHSLIPSGHRFVLRQGRFAGRPSTIHVRPEGTSDNVEGVSVGGDVALVGHGTLEVLP